MKDVALNPLLLERSSWSVFRKNEMTDLKDFFAFNQQACNAVGPASCHGMHMSQPPAYIKVQFEMEDMSCGYPADMDEEELERYERELHDFIPVKAEVECGRFIDLDMACELREMQNADVLEPVDRTERELVLRKVMLLEDEDEDEDY
ncbi:hypothetical protein LTS10_010446 [Elasticomyces elasticus]|nr:hypothetical protein LTS10_010446 [Elasticomyces elasticus]